MENLLRLLVLGCLLIPLCAAQDMDEIEGDHSVDAAFVTAHTAWARPYARGTIRVLFFVNGRGTCAREVIELKQRFDIDPQMVFWGRIVDTPRDDWHGGELGLRRMKRLLDEPWDVFVFQDVSPTHMPIEQQYAMIKAVTEGAGLVLLGTHDKRVLKDKNQFEQTPEFLHDVDGAAAFTIKQGRGILLPKRPTIEYRPGWEVAHDQWAMRTGKAILWAAAREPKLSVTLTPRGPELAREALPAKAILLAWKGAADTRRLTAHITLRREDGTMIGVEQPSLKKPEGTLELAIPLVQAGHYFLDAIVTEGRGKTVAGFGSVNFTVTDLRHVQEIKLARDWAEIGEQLSGEVVLSERPAADARLIVSLRDRRGRELARQFVPPDENPPTFSFDVQPWFPMLCEVRTTLLDGEHEVASNWQFAHVVKRRRGRFNFVMWDTPRGNLGPVAEESLVRNGVTVQLGSGNPQKHVAAHDVAWIPYTIHIKAKWDDKGIMQPVCWNDQDAIQAHVDAIVEKHLPSRQHGVFAYSLGDEISVRGSCVKPCCLDAYREYLRKKYRDIGALNASWTSAYASFAEVQLSLPDDNDENEALRTGNFPRWYDRQAFQSYNFCKLCERFGEAFRRMDPQSRCGFEGAGTFRHGDDLDGFVRYNTFWSPYPGTADEVLRSIAPRDFPRANWMGYTKDADSLLEKYWRMVTRGCDAVWWWRWEVVGRFHGWLMPNLDPYPAVREILRDTRIVREGLGDLLLYCDMQTDGIGILYSQPSAYAARVQTSPTYGSYEGSHSACHHAIRALGLNFLYFTDRQMRLGEVDLSLFKVIFLPMTQAMGPREAEMFREYVRNGGVLVADVRPAIYDGHVKPLLAGQLDDVFGIRRTDFGAALNLDAEVLAASDDGGQETLRFTNVLADGGIEAAGAAAAGTAGEAPIVLTHSFGQGRAVLLNLTMGSYPQIGAESAPETAARLWRSILEMGQVSPMFELFDASGQRLRNVEVTHWMNGPVRIVSLFRHKGLAETAELHLPEAMHAYELKNGTYLGRGQTVRVAVTPYRADFYAISPERITPVAIDMPRSVAAGDVQRVAITSAMPEGKQAVHVQVIRPDGTVADWVDPVAVVDSRGTVVDVPVAFNDPSGRWAVSVTELYTGRSTIRRFTVR